eukprot:g1237.t1
MMQIAKISFFFFLLPLQGISTIHITVNPKQQEKFTHYWKRSFGSGHAALGLRKDWQDALHRATADYGLQGIRQHGIFDDDMKIVSARNGTLEFNFTLVDQLWDEHVRNNVQPIVELGFMPLVLANCSSPKFPRPALSNCTLGGWVRTGVPAPPMHWRDWYNLVHTTVLHAVERYGIDEILTWHFEVWNEMWGVPGVHDEVSTGIYTSTFYKFAVEAIKSIDKRLKVGGPALASPLGLKGFLQEVDDLNLPIDFVSTHIYGNPRECPHGAAGAAGQGHSKDDVGLYWNPNCYFGLVKWARSQVPENIPFFITEYSIGVGENVTDHDTTAAAAFIFQSASRMHNVVDVSSWWAFTDIFEEVGLPPEEFSGYYGLETISGIAKPGKRAFELLHKFAGSFLVNTTVSQSVETEMETEWETEFPPSNNNNNNNNNRSCRVTKDLGCFDQKSHRDTGCFDTRDAAALGYNNTTVESCLAFCSVSGAADGGAKANEPGLRVRYIGIENGNQCWCSSKALHKATCQAVPSTRCNTPCSGDTSTTMGCGGGWAISVYGVECSDKPIGNQPMIVHAFATTFASKDDDDDDDDGITIFISSWEERDMMETKTPVEVKVQVQNSKEWNAVLHMIDAKHANPKAAWVKMGRPAKPTPSQIEVLKAASAVSSTGNIKIDRSKESELVLRLDVPSNAAYVIVLERFIK